MPRIAFTTWRAPDEPENDNRDYCNDCYEIAQDDFPESEDVEHGAEHPEYDGTIYTCEVCGCKLKDSDN